MIDPHTENELHPDWQPLSEMPPLPTGKTSFSCLVLLKTPNNKGERILLGSYHKNMTVIGGLFEYDAPPVIAWQHLPII